MAVNRANVRPPTRENCSEAGRGNRSVFVHGRPTAAGPACSVHRPPPGGLPVRTDPYVDGDERAHALRTPRWLHTRVCSHICAGQSAHTTSSCLSATELPQWASGYTLEVPRGPRSPHRRRPSPGPRRWARRVGPTAEVWKPPGCKRTAFRLKGARSPIRLRGACRCDKGASWPRLPCATDELVFRVRWERYEGPCSSGLAPDPEREPCRPRPDPQLMSRCATCSSPSSRPGPGPLPGWSATSLHWLEPSDDRAASGRSRIRCGTYRP